MREITTLTIKPPNQHLVKAIFPISRGPYLGPDVLLVMSNMCGRYYVVRSTLAGEVKDKGSVHQSVPSLKQAIEIAESMIAEQSNKDCDAVTGNGRWGCE